MICFDLWSYSGTLISKWKRRGKSDNAYTLSTSFNRSLAVMVTECDVYIFLFVEFFSFHLWAFLCKIFFTALIMFRYMSAVFSFLTNLNRDINVFITIDKLQGFWESLARVFIFKTVTQYSADNTGRAQGQSHVAPVRIQLSKL